MDVNIAIDWYHLPTWFPNFSGHFQAERTEYDAEVDGMAYAAYLLAKEADGNAALTE